MRALRRAFSLGFPAGAIVVFIHWRGAAEVARRIRCAPWPAPVLSFFVIGSASSGVSVAATGLRRAGEGSASCFLSRISGWRDRRLYPLAGGSRGGAANPVRAVAGAGAVIFCDWVGELGGQRRRDRLAAGW